MRLRRIAFLSALVSVVSALGTRDASAQDLKPPPPLGTTQTTPTPPPPPPPPPQPAPTQQSLVQPAQPQPQPAQPGIAPPPPMGPSTPVGPGPTGSPEDGTGPTTAKLDEAENKDSGRNFELFWLDAHLGGSYIDMRQFSSESFQVEKASAGGPSFAVGAGFRLVVFVAGVRLRHHALSSFNMWQINAEAGMKIPIGQLDLLFDLHGGYSFVGRLGDAGQVTNQSTPASTDAVSIRGFNGGLEVGVDYYVSSVFSVGAGVLGDFLFLNRPPVALPAGFEQLPADQQARVKADPLYQQSGTSAGLQLTGGLRLGLHFGL